MGLHGYRISRVTFGASGAFATKNVVSLSYGYTALRNDGKNREFVLNHRIPLDDAEVVVEVNDGKTKSLTKKGFKVSTPKDGNSVISFSKALKAEAYIMVHYVITNWHLLLSDNPIFNTEDPSERSREQRKLSELNQARSNEAVRQAEGAEARGEKFKVEKTKELKTLNLDEVPATRFDRAGAERRKDDIKDMQENDPASLREPTRESAVDPKSAKQYIKENTPDEISDDEQRRRDAEEEAAKNEQKEADKRFKAAEAAREAETKASKPKTAKRGASGKLPVTVKEPSAVRTSPQETAQSPLPPLEDAQESSTEGRKTAQKARNERDQKSETRSQTGSRLDAGNESKPNQTRPQENSQGQPKQSENKEQSDAQSPPPNQDSK